jgi:hypothetical protein
MADVTIIVTAHVFSILKLSMSQWMKLLTALKATPENIFICRPSVEFWERRNVKWRKTISKVFYFK